MSAILPASVPFGVRVCSLFVLLVAPASTTNGQQAGQKTIEVTIANNQHVGIAYGKLQSGQVYTLRVDIKAAANGTMPPPTKHDFGGGVIWQRTTANANLQAHTFRATPVDANSIHTVWFEGRIIAPAPGGTQGTPRFTLAVADIDIDVDSAEAFQDQIWTPTGNDAEDEDEFGGNTSGLFLPPSLLPASMNNQFPNQLAVNTNVAVTSPERLQNPNGQQGQPGFIVPYKLLQFTLRHNYHGPLGSNSTVGFVKWSLSGTGYAVYQLRTGKRIKNNDPQRLSNAASSQTPVDDYYAIVTNDSFNAQGAIQSTFRWVQARQATANVTAGGQPGVSPHDAIDRVRIRPFRLNLIARTIGHQGNNYNHITGDLAENEEEKPGAFVPRNLDDDDGNGKNDVADQANPHDNDLLEVQIDPVPAGRMGFYRLTIPTGFRVYRNSSHTSPVTGVTANSNGTSIPTSDTQPTLIYVEAGSFSSGLLKLHWANQQNANHAIDDGDRVFLTCVEMQGPENVPGFTRYRYKAKIVGPDPATAAWQAPPAAHGALAAQPATPLERDVNWNAGGFVGRIPLLINSRYTWDKEVNVVNIQFAQQGNTVTMTNNIGQSGTSSRISSAPLNRPAMAATASITQITSPMRGANRQGATQLEIGYIQLGAVLNMEGVYNDVVVNGNVAPQLRRATKLVDGNTHVDTVRGAKFPWYHTRRPPGTPRPPAVYNPPNNNGVPPGGTVPLTTGDRPSIPGTDLLGVAGDPLDFVNIRVGFQLFIAVRTKDTDLDAHKVFTQRAILTGGWGVNLSGSMPGTTVPNNYGTWTRIGRITGNTLAGAGIAIGGMRTTAFTAVSSRARVTVPQGAGGPKELFDLENNDTLNDLLDGNPGWTTIDKPAGYPAAFSGTRN